MEILQAKTRNTSKECGVRLLFVGSPLLDITAHCGPELLTRYALEADGCTVADERHDALFEHLLCETDTRMNAGGSALNSAVIARWAAGTSGSVSFIGCVGEDEAASRLSDDLLTCGVEPLFVTIPGASTGVCACLLSSGGQKRSLCTRQGASALFQKDHLRSIYQKVSEADCLFVTGYLLCHSPEVVMELAGKLRSHQILALSLSAEYVCRDFRDAVLKVLPRIDVLLGNEFELMALAEDMHIGLTVEEAASSIAIWEGTRTVVISRGPQPVVLVRGREVPRHFPVPQNIPVLDSTGCGDALAGAFLSVLILTGDPQEAVRAGIRAAAEIAMTPGCRPPSKRLEDMTS